MAAPPATFGNALLKQQYFADVVKSDSVDFTPGPPSAIYVGGAGDVAVVDRDGNATTLKAVPVGTTLHISPRRINSTNTTATLMVAMW